MTDEAVTSIFRQAVADSATLGPPMGNPIMAYEPFATNILDALDSAGFTVERIPNT